MDLAAAEVAGVVVNTLRGEVTIQQVPAEVGGSAPDAIMAMIAVTPKTTYNITVGAGGKGGAGGVGTTSYVSAGARDQWQLTEEILRLVN